LNSQLTLERSRSTSLLAARSSVVVLLMLLCITTHLESESLARSSTSTQIEPDFSRDPASGAIESDVPTINVGADSDPLFFPVWTEVVISLAAEGHPESLTIYYALDRGPWLKLKSCESSWGFRGEVFYSFDGGTIVLADPVSATVVGCEIFADDFESGDTTNWTLSVP